MKPRLILHAGTHKTGTTALQLFCASNRRAFLERQVIIPTTHVAGRHALQHHEFGHSFVGASKRLDVAGAVSVAQDWADKAKRSAAVTFLSTESLWRHVVPAHGRENWLDRRNEYLQRVAEALFPFEVEVVLVFRRPDNFVRSLYLERVKSSRKGVQESFAEFRMRTLNETLRYGDNALLFSSFFGKVRCLLYEELVKADFYQSFFDAIGIDITGMKRPGRVRESLSVSQAQILNYAKTTGTRAWAKKDVADWLKTEQIQEISANLQGQGSFDIWKNVDERSDFLDQTKAQVELLRRNFRADKDELFDDLAVTDTLPYLPALPDELKTRVSRATEDFFENRGFGLPSRWKLQLGDFFGINRNRP